MSEPLDRPVWNALTGPQAGLAAITGAAIRIDPAYGPFAAARDEGQEAQAALAATLEGASDRIGVVERHAWPTPPGTRVLGGGDLVQMVYRGEYMWIESAIAGAPAGTFESCGVTADVRTALEDKYNGVTSIRW